MWTPLTLTSLVLSDRITSSHPIRSNPIHAQAFLESWEELDKEGSGFIDATNLTALLESVPAPVGVKVGQGR